MIMTNMHRISRLILITNRKRVLVTAALALLLIVPPCRGQGTMSFIFEGQPHGTFDPIGIYLESGMRFWNPYGPNNLTLAGGGVNNRPENGTGYLQVTPGANLVFGFYTFPGTLFNLLSFDAAEFATNNPGPVSLTVVGYQGMDIAVTNYFTTDGINDGTGPMQDFQTFLLTSQFVDLYRVEILSDRFSIDNVIISGVPEPSTLGLVLLATLCVLARPRIRQRRP